MIGVNKMRADRCATGSPSGSTVRIVYVIDDRKLEGFFEPMTVVQNILAGHWGSAQPAPFILRASVHTNWLGNGSAS